MSPITREELNTFVKIIKDGNLRFHATQFCNSANLLCSQSVNLSSASESNFLGNGDLELNHFVSRTVLDTKPITVEYAITEYGATLSPLISELAKWGIQYRQSVHG